MINRQLAAMMASKTAANTKFNKKGGETDIKCFISAIKAMTASSGNADVSAAAATTAPKKSVAEVAEVQLRAILKKAKFD